MHVITIYYLPLTINHTPLTMTEILNILGTVGFNWHVALANFFNFLIILFLLQKFFFGKIRSTIQKRANIIEEGLNNAEDAAMFLRDAEV